MEPLCGQKPFSIEGGHTACTCRRYCLSVDFILSIATGKNSRNIGPCTARNSLYVSLLVHIEPSLKYVSIGLVTYCHKKAGNRQNLFFVGFSITYFNAIY